MGFINYIILALDFKLLFIAFSIDFCPKFNSRFWEIRHGNMENMSIVGKFARMKEEGFLFITTKKVFKNIIFFVQKNIVFKNSLN